jgi:hypothetical protein
MFLDVFIGNFPSKTSQWIQPVVVAHPPAEDPCPPTSSSGYVMEVKFLAQEAFGSIGFIYIYVIN